MRKFTGKIKLSDGTIKGKRWEVHNKPPKTLPALLEMFTRPYGPDAEVTELTEVNGPHTRTIDLTSATLPPVPDGEE